jgi:hypothetical protein
MLAGTTVDAEGDGSSEHAGDCMFNCSSASCARQAIGEISDTERWRGTKAYLFVDLGPPSFAHPLDLFQETIPA